MKKLWILLLICVLLLSFVACSDKEDTTETSGTAEQTQTQAPEIPGGDYSFNLNTEDGTIVTPILPFN